MFRASFFVAFSAAGGQNDPVHFIRSIREDDCMKKEPPVVHCIFAQTDETLSKLLETAFRQYLAHILAARDESTGQSMQ